MQRPIDVVIDGTNFGGKTPLVGHLISKLRAQGFRVETASPYKEVEVYSMWDANPIGAARIICERMQQHRARAADADVFVWDRGWPTCYVATANSAARSFFEPLPPLTFLLLNTAEVTQRKVHKYNLNQQVYPWMYGHRLKDEISYQELARRFPQEVRCFHPTLEDSRFDLEHVTHEILHALTQLGQLRALTRVQDGQPGQDTRMA